MSFSLLAGSPLMTRYARLRLIYLCAALLLISLLAPRGSPAVLTTQVPESDLPLELPGPVKPRSDAAELQKLHKLAPTSRSAAAWRRLAEDALGRGAYAVASEAYRKESAVYRAQGDTNAAQVEESKAARYFTDIALYQRRLTTAEDRKHYNSGARLEPPVGCYVGAFIDRDDSLRSYPLDGQKYGSVKDFTLKVGKKHASYLMYRSWGQPFPKKWVNYTRQHGAIPQIAWEPDDLSEVKEGSYLDSWVDQTREAGPVFIRFASEMNGNWVRYHGDPEAYKKAFRTVYNAFRKAPHAALIWCPNSIPREGVDAYYPGDDATDWVGVNLYCVLFADNNKSQSADHRHPTDLIDHIYKKYGARKPIAICEWAATHMAALDRVARPDFAESKIAQMYRSLPTRYPRIKLVTWFDCNNIEKAPPGRQLNNFLITDDEVVTGAYHRAISSPYYLGADELRTADASPVVVVPLKSGDQVPREAVLEAWLRTYVLRPKTYFRVDGKVVYATGNPNRHLLPFASLPQGKHAVEVLVFDDENRFVTSSKVTLNLRARTTEQKWTGRTRCTL